MKTSHECWFRLRLQLVFIRVTFGSSYPRSPINYFPFYLNIALFYRD